MSTTGVISEYHRFLRRYTGNRLYVFALISLFGGYTEAIGLALFLPLFSADPSQGRDGLSRAVVSVIHFVGREPTVEGILPLMVVLFTLKGLVQYLSGRYQFLVTAELTRTLRSTLVGKLEEVSYPYVVGLSAGGMTNLVSSEIGRATAGFMTFSRLLPNVLNASIFFVILLFIDLKLTLLITVVVLVLFSLMRFPARLTRVQSVRTSEANHKMSSFLTQMIQSYKYLIATARFHLLRDRIFESVNNAADASFRIGKLNTFTAAIAQPIMALFLASVLLYQTRVAGQSFAAILVMVLYMYRIMLEVFAFQSQWQEACAVVGGLTATRTALGELDTHREEDGARVFAGLQSMIELRDLDFAYGPVDVLHSVNLKIAKNTMVAIVGESGAGKSTLVDLLSGVLHPKRGAVLIDGEDLRQFSRVSWRQRLGYVPQECVLYDDTIANNLAMWSCDIADPQCFERIQTVARQTHCLEFIEAMPQKYQTPVGERGVKLSGGQKQRIAIAKELFRNPEVLILDEATSALDTASERFVQESIDNLKGKMTIVMIAHRLSTIRAADYVYVLNHGRVVESGPYATLYADVGSRFRKMCDLQRLE